MLKADQAEHRKFENVKEHLPDCIQYKKVSLTPNSIQTSLLLHVTFHCSDRSQAVFHLMVQYQSSFTFCSYNFFIVTYKTYDCFTRFSSLSVWPYVQTLRLLLGPYFKRDTYQNNASILYSITCKLSL